MNTKLSCSENSHSQVYLEDLRVHVIYNVQCYMLVNLLHINYPSAFLSFYFSLNHLNAPFLNRVLPGSAKALRWHFTASDWFDLCYLHHVTPDMAASEPSKDGNCDFFNVSAALMRTSGGLHAKVWVSVTLRVCGNSQSAEKRLKKSENHAGNRPAKLAG